MCICEIKTVASHPQLISTRDFLLKSIEVDWPHKSSSLHIENDLHGWALSLFHVKQRERLKEQYTVTEHLF